MPAVRDDGLTGTSSRDLLSAGLISVAPGAYQLRDPERLDLLTPAGRRRAVALARGAPAPSYSGGLKRARTRDYPAAAAVIGWSPSSHDVAPSLGQLRTRLQDRAAIEQGTESVHVEGSHSSLVRRIIAAILCDVLDAGGRVQVLQCPGLAALVEPAVVRIDVTTLGAALGRELPGDQAGAALRSLGYRVLRPDDDEHVRLTAPMWRADVSPADVMADLSDVVLLAAPVTARWTAPAATLGASGLASALTGLGYQEIPLRRATDIGIADIARLRVRVRAWAGGLRRTAPPRGFDLIPMLRPGRENTSTHLCMFSVASSPDPNPLFSALWSLAGRFGASLMTDPADTAELLPGSAFTVSAGSLFDGLFGILPEPAANRWISMAILELPDII